LAARKKAILAEVRSILEDIIKNIKGGTGDSEISPKPYVLRECCWSGCNDAH
jgi:hypothetical protein